MKHRFCTNCGKPIVGEGKFCASCGVPAAEAEAQKAGSNAQPVINANNTNKRGIIVKLTSAAAVVLVAIVAICILFGGGNKIMLPYGINPEMTIYETQDQMLKAGFVKHGGDESDIAITVYYDSSLVLGYMTDFTSLLHFHNGVRISVTHYFHDPGYSAGNESPMFQMIKGRIIDEYGNPESENGYEWIDNDYKIIMKYHSDGNFSVEYRYINSEAK